MSDEGTLRTYNTYQENKSTDGGVTEWRGEKLLDLDPLMNGNSFWRLWSVFASFCLWFIRLDKNYNERVKDRRDFSFLTAFSRGNPINTRLLASCWHTEACLKCQQTLWASGRVERAVLFTS